MMLRSGLTRAARRHLSVQRFGVPWRTKEFYAEEEVEEEMRRVLDACHGCRRCVSLCDVFPTVFKALEEVEMEEVPSSVFKEVQDKCTLCDMCYAHTCPYVPPHEWELDLPHLVLRYRALEAKKDNEAAAARLREALPEPEVPARRKQMESYVEEGVSRQLELGAPSYVHRLISDQDLVGRAGVTLSSVANVATSPGSPLRALVGIHKEAPLPRFAARAWVNTVKKSLVPEPKRKAVLFASCSVNHSHPEIGDAAVAVLNHLGVETRVEYPGCCGMPQLEQGLVGDVSERALKITPVLLDYVERGYDVVSLTPSCTLMLKQEWPLLLSEVESVQRLASSTSELSEYVHSCLKEYAPDLEPVDASVTLHHACHARAQNMGFTAQKMLSHINGVTVTSIERCSGHGGTWGVMEKHHETAKKFGAPVVARVKQDAAESKNALHFVASECPLAATHLAEQAGARKLHPIQIVASALGYGNFTEKQC